MKLTKEIIENSIKTDKDGQVYAVCSGLTLHSVFQPIFDGNNEIFGYEALIRIKNRDGKNVQPDHFFNSDCYSFKEQVLIERVSRAVHLRNFARSHMRHSQLFLNVLPKVTEACFLDGEGTKLLIQRLKELKLKPEQIVIELTEPHANDDKQLQKAMQHLQELGFNIAVDDYGFQGSDEKRVRMLEPNILKTDKSLLLNFMTGNCNPLNDALKLGRHVNAKVIIEGIETEDQFRHVQNLDADMFQGYHLATPQYATP